MCALVNSGIVLAKRPEKKLCLPMFTMNKLKNKQKAIPLKS